MTAVPFEPPDWKRASARPFASVSAVAGATVPREVVKVTSVPLCGGVPDGSITCATISTLSLAERTLVDDVNVMVEPVGARSGDTSQPDTARATRASATKAIVRQRVTISAI